MKKIILALLLSVSCLTVNAQLPPGNPYIGLQMGYGTLDLSAITEVPNYSLNGGGFAFRIFGGYEFILIDYFHFGGEIGYTQYPSSKYTLNGFGLDQTATSYTSSYVDFLATGKYYFINGWNLVGKAGFAFLNQSTGFFSTSQARSTLAPELGAAFGYDFNNMLAVHLNYYHVFGSQLSQNDIITGNPDKFVSVDTYMLSLSYTFP